MAIMSRVYSCALRVIIYLGQNPNGHGSKVIALLSDIDDFLQSGMATLESLGWNVFPRLEEYTNQPLLTDERWHSVRTLLEQRWFDRGWVVREAGLARQSVIVWVDQHISTLQDFVPQAVWAPSTLLIYLAHRRAFHFSERRNNRYSFLDLAAKPMDGFHLIPNCAKPMLESFRDFAIEYLTTASDQTMLSYVVHDTRSLQCTLPSWVPQWGFLEPGYDDEFSFFFTLHSQQAVDPVFPAVLDLKILKLRHALWVQLLLLRRLFTNLLRHQS